MPDHNHNSKFNIIGLNLIYIQFLYNETCASTSENFKSTTISMYYMFSIQLTICIYGVWVMYFICFLNLTQKYPPPHKVNERAVRILLECILVLVNISNWRVACSEWNNSRNIKKWNHFNANIVSVEKVLRDVVRQSHANVLPLGGISTDKGQSVIMKNLPNLVQCRRYSRALVTTSRSILFRSCRDSEP